MQEAETAIRDVQKGVTRSFDLVENLINIADKAIEEIERRDRIGALRQIAIACKRKCFRYVGGDRLNIWYEEVCPRSFKHLEEKFIRKNCKRSEDADYFIKRVKELKIKLNITDLARLHRGYTNCTDDLHGEFHQTYNLNSDELIQMAQNHLEHHQYQDWKRLLNMNVKLTANTNGNIFRDN